MQLIPINEDQTEFNVDFYLKGNDEFHFAVCDQESLDNGTPLDFKQSTEKQVSGNIKSSVGDPKSYYIALKSINEKVDINVSLAPRPIDMTPKPSPPPPPQQRMPPQQQRMPPQQQQQRMPPQQQQQRMSPQQQQQRMPPQQQQRMPPQQQQRMSPQQQQQQRMPPQQQQRMPPQQQQRRPPQQQQRMPPQQQQRRPSQQQQRRPPQQQQRRPPQKRYESSHDHDHHHSDMTLVKGISPAVLCIGGITVVVLGTAVWYLFLRKKGATASKLPNSSEAPVVESVGAVDRVLEEGSDLLSKLKSLPSSSRSRSRV